MDAVTPGPGRVERRIVVAGAVQGVGYRWFTRELAHRFRMAGWVRNMPDGTVVLEVAVDAVDLDRIVDALRAGPPAAVVSGVTVTSRTDDSPLPDHFTVLR